MREIKFRQPIRDKSGNFVEWWYWGIIDNSFISPVTHQNGNDTKHESQQLTGLHDKNGKEIYELDIVICSYFKMSVGPNLGATEVDAELKGVIKFNDLSLCVTNIVGEKWSHYTGYDSGEGSCEITYLHDVYEGSTEFEMSVEVIGSIFESPELLK